MKELYITEFKKMEEKYGGSVYTNEWTKGNMDRTYFNYKGSSKSSKVESYGYYDNVKNEYIGNKSRTIIL